MCSLFFEYNFQQLLSILPPRSKNLVPTCFHPIFERKEFTTEFEMDLLGKRSDHEGIVKLPFIYTRSIVKEYDKYKGELTDREKKRNIRGKMSVYKMRDGRVEVRLEN